MNVSFDQQFNSRKLYYRKLCTRIFIEALFKQVKVGVKVKHLLINTVSIIMVHSYDGTLLNNFITRLFTTKLYGIYIKLLVESRMHLGGNM